MFAARPRLRIAPRLNSQEDNVQKITVKSVGLIAVALSALMTSVVATGAQGGKVNVKADTLTGYQETPTISSTGTGTFTAEIDEDAGVITYELTYSGLSSSAVAAHIHFGGRYLAGSVTAFLCGGPKPVCPAGTTSEAVVTGTITAADILGIPAQGITAGDIASIIQAIRSGVTYVNVHTPNHPGGEIRGQVNDEDQRQP